MTPCSALWCADDARRLGAQQLGRVGVLLLRHDRGARAPGVAERAEAELLAAPQHELGAQPREVRRERRRSGEVVQREVAVGDGVDRVRRRRRRSPALRATSAAVGREVHARERTGAERQHAARRRRPPRSARGRAAASTRRRAGGGRDRPAGRAGGGCSPASASRGGARRGRAGPRSAPSSPARAAAAASRTNITTSVATWSLRERAVCSLPPTRPDDLGQPALDRHVDVLVVGREREASRRASSPATASRPASSSSRSAVGDHADRGEHRRVRARLRDVVAPQAPVEVERGVDRLEVRILGLREARHRRR